MSAGYRVDLQRRSVAPDGSNLSAPLLSRRVSLNCLLQRIR